MSGEISRPVTEDAHRDLRDSTAARIALGRSGGSLPTREVLQFTLAHARARDAVHATFNVQALLDDLEPLSAVAAASRAGSLAEFLGRPDYGRQLSPDSRNKLTNALGSGPYDLTIVISNGLSADAAQRHAPSLLEQLIPMLQAERWRLAPVVVVEHGRVAIADEIGELAGSQLALILLGERPGLGSPDSLGAYLVFDPRVGRTDAERNCVSNIRPEGLAIDAAANTLFYLLSESKRRKISGVELKDARALGDSAESDRGRAIGD